MSTVDTDADVMLQYKDLPPDLKDVLQVLDVDGKGYVSKQELQEMVASRRTSQGRGQQSAVASSCIVKDLNLSGKRVTKADMEQVHSTIRNLQVERQTYRRVVCGMVMALIVLSLATFAACFAAVELAKETHLKGDTITTGSGATALIGSADTQVVDGTLVSRSEDQQGSCNNSTEGCGKRAIATRPAQEHRQLDSRIANKVFESLDAITFSFGADSSNTMTFRIHGFVRAKSARSRHGTVVHLELLKGTLTIDGTSIYLDSSLESYLETFGVLAAGQQLYAHGRRLQEGQAVVTGIFSLFEDVEFEYIPEGEEKPRGPTLPYRMSLLERRPCETTEACKSQLFEGEFLPGYDAATNSITTKVEIVETESWMMSILQMPNHPTQKLMTITDHSTQTTRLIQFTSEDFATRCTDTNYTAGKPTFDPEEWYVTYVGEVERQETVYEVLDEVYTVPGSVNRFFHLISKNVSSEVRDEDAVFHFEDDSSTLQFKRLFVPNAVAEGWTTQELIVLEVEEINDTEASGYLDIYSPILECGMDGVNTTFLSDFPIIGSDVFEEDLEEVVYYVQDFVDVGSTGLGWYWQKAVESQALLEAALTTQREGLELELENMMNETNESSGRRLASIDGVPTSSANFFCQKLPTLSSRQPAIELCYSTTWPNRRSDCPGCICHTIGMKGGAAVEDDDGVGWYGMGEVGIGTLCNTAGKFGAYGSLTVGYNSEVKESESKLGVKVTVKCQLTIALSGTGYTGKFGYKCSGYSGIYECDKDKDKALRAWERWCNSKGHPIYNSRRLEDQEDESVSVDTDEVEDADEEIENERRLGDSRRRAGLYEDPHRRRRTRYCSREKWNRHWDDTRRRFNHAVGGAFDIKVPGGGSCSVGGGKAGVGIGGSLWVSFGPFPKKPFKPKSKGGIDVKVCVKVGVEICVKLFRATFWSKDL